MGDWYDSQGSAAGREAGRTTQPFSFEFSCSCPCYLCIKILKRSPLLLMFYFT